MKRIGKKCDDGRDVVSVMACAEPKIKERQYMKFEITRPEEGVQPRYEPFSDEQTAGDYELRYKRCILASGRNAQRVFFLQQQSTANKRALVVCAAEC